MGFQIGKLVRVSNDSMAFGVMDSREVRWYSIARHR